MMGLPEHQRIIPHLDISEQALRELEIWLLGRLRAVRASGGGLQYHEGTYGPENVGDYLHSTTDVATVFSLTDGADFFIDRPGSTSNHILQIDDTTGSIWWYQAGGRWFHATEGGDYFLDTGTEDDTSGGNVDELTNGGYYHIDTTFIGSDDPGADGTYQLLAGDIIVNASQDINISAGETAAVNVADGQTFVVNDHLGSPLVTYTG